ncbi:MAG: hypothetical protein KDB47_07025 [Mycobacterium sp.]|nr:hypothetical protein [Mycobacterium sp.]
MNTLTITFGDMELFSGNVDELTFTVTAGGVSVTGKKARAGSSPNSPGLIGLLAQSSRRKASDSSPLDDGR